MWKKIWSLVPTDPGNGVEDKSSGIPDDIIAFVEKFRIIKGKPFSFEGRDYLKQIYRDPAKKVYIVKARQVEITEFAVNLLLYHLLTHPGTVGLYVSDRDKHVKSFSRDRLLDAIYKSKILRDQMVEGGNKSFRKFKNGSMLHMVSGWNNFEEARSFAVDFAVIDEVQSLNAEAIPVLSESLSKSEHGKLFVIGTGSNYGDAWWKLWHSGNQMEWDLQNKKWVAKNPEITDVSSYHISQHMAFWISPEKIKEKRRENPPRYFTNEVQGWWHKGMQRPLTRDDIMQLFDKTIDFTPAEDVKYGLPIFAGIDFGGGTQAFTVVWIWQLVNENVPRFKVLNVIKIDDPSTENQADMIINLIDKYKIDKIVCDSGGGARQVEKLSKRYGSRIYKCNYSYNSDEPFKKISSEYRVLADRTWIIEVIIDLIKRPEPSQMHPGGVPRIHIPYSEPDKINWMIDHFTCIEAKTANSMGRSFVQYVHGDETNDDALHAACYAYLAYKVSKGKEWKVI